MDADQDRIQDSYQSNLIEEQFRLIVEAAPNGIIVVNERGKMRLVNVEIEKMFGYRREALIGKQVEMLVPERFRGHHPSFRTDFMKHPEERPMGAGRDLFGLRKDCSEFPVEIGLKPIKTREHTLILCTVVDITERKRAEERFRLVVESAPNGIVMVDHVGKILLVNTQIEKSFGYSRTELIGQRIEMLVPERFRGKHPEYRKEFMASPNARPMGAGRDLFGLRKDGTEFPIEIGLNPIETEQGTLVLSTIVDITERKQIETERIELLEREQAARKQAEDANRMKDEFIAIVSHELRTPLTSILGWTRMLRAGKLDESAANKAIETVERNARSQAQLIEDLLDVARITTGKMRLDVRAVDPAAVIKAAADSLRPAADAKNVQIQTILDSRAGPIAGDHERLQQVVWNLLSNAIKFTPKNKRVQMQLERINSHIEITISDNGPGIKPDFLPIIFQRFTQADSPITRSHGGLGIGLAIVKHIVELHGGTVAAGNKEGGSGAIFSVKLPLMALRRDVGPEERAHPQSWNEISIECPPEIDGLRILAVDDQPDTVEMLEAIFAQCGAEVRSATSMAEALGVLDIWIPNVIVADIGMPDGDGYDFIRHIRSLPAEKGGKTPAVALTAFARVEDRVKVLSAGYQMHVPKPIEPGELLTIVASLAGVMDKK